jgi:glycosyltransferase involved in cell wall biosynthesis
LKTNKTHFKNVILGPGITGLGGISRVAKIWRDVGIFDATQSCYIATVTDEPVNRAWFLIKALLASCYRMAHGSGCVYIHTSSNHSFYRKSLFIVLATVLGKQIYLHIHPSHFFEFINNCRGLNRLYALWCLSRINQFIVLTNSMQSKIGRLFPHKPVSVLMNPVDIKSMGNTGNWIRAHNRLIYLGWYIPQKGVFELVDAIERLIISGVDIEMDFYGTRQVQKLRDYVETKKMESCVRVNGWINGEDKLRVLYECTAIVLPSHSEGIPNVILEAMATKTPIIATSVGGLADILRDGENAFISPVNDPVGLSNVIHHCLSHPEDRSRIADHAYLEAIDLYDIDVIKPQIISIIGMN